MLIVSATQEDEVGESLEPNSARPAGQHGKTLYKKKNV
jgi:hypothetical protein